MTEQPGMPRQRSLDDALAAAYSIPDEQLPLAHVTAAANRLYGDLNYDKKTGLHNGNAFVSAVEHMIPQVPEGHTLRVVMYDLDGFKAVNDGLGHAAGDAVLSITGEEMARDYSRSNEIVAHGSRDSTATVARLSGDEFAAAYFVPLESDQQGARRRRPVEQSTPNLPGEPGLLPIDAQTQRVISGWKDRIQNTDYARYNIGLTAGMADLKPGDTAATLLSEADGALKVNKYESKTQGIVDRTEAEADFTDLVTTLKTLELNGLRVPEVLPFAIRRVADKIGAPLPPDLNL